MSQPHDDSRISPPAAARPTLGALLRLKRAERPDAAFWSEFDRGLRQKQLAAIIEPRPWWLGLSLFARRFAPYGLPASAAAAALLALVAIRTEPPLSRVAAPVLFAPSQTAQAVEPVVSAAGSAANRLAAVPEPASVRADAAPEVAVIAAPAPVLAAAAAPVLPALLELPAGLPEVTPSQRTIEQNLAAVRAEAGEFASVTEPAALSTPDDEPLKMVVFNPRHARVLLAMADNPEVQASGGIAHLRDRMVHSLNRDEALYGSASRLGVGGDRLSVSF